MIKTAQMLIVAMALSVPCGKTLAQQPAGTGAATCTAMDECFAEWSCRLPPAVPRLSATVTLTPGRFLSEDGKGPYLEGADSSLVYVRAAVSLHATSPKVRRSMARRFLRIDMTHPVDSATPSLGIIEDPYSDFHAWGPTLARRGVEPVIQYLSVGSTWNSALTHIDFTYHGRYYLLQLGPEALGEGCNRGGTALFGTGTTAVTVSRPQHNVYVVDAPVGSVGRLFDISNKIAGAVDKGLYYMNFRLVFQVADASLETRHNTR